MKEKKLSIALYITIIFLSLFAVFFVYFAIRADSLNAQQGNPAAGQFRYVKNDAYGFGERLDYKVKYAFVVAGEGFFHILTKPIYRNNRECYDIRFQVNSLKSLEWIYRVKDNFRTALDVAGIFPWEIEQIIREGDYKKDYKATFDQVNNTAFNGNRKYKVQPYIHDIVSAFFYVRTMNLGSMKPGSVFFLMNFFDDTTNKLGVKILGKQTCEVEAGKFNCIVVEPLVVQGGLFKSEGKILIWLTDDERKIPVKVSTKILIGYVSADLVSYRGTRGPIRAKIE